MSAPVSHHPLVVNTQDGSCWIRRAVSRDGRGLYALAGSVAGVPDEVLVSLADLAELGITGSAYALPMPVGSVVRSELDQARDDVVGACLARWEEEQENARLRLALASAKRGRSKLRVRVAELEQLLADAPVAVTLTERAAEAADKLTRLFAPTQALREDSYDGPLHHDWRLGRDLPEMGGGLRSCCAGPVCTCTVASPQDDEHIPPQGEASDADRIVAYRAPGSGSLYCAACCQGNGIFGPMTSEELPDGGLCDGCDVDVLIEQTETGAQ